MIKLLRNVVAVGFLGLALNANADVSVFFDNLENGTNGWTMNGMTDGDSNIYDGGLWHFSQRWSASTNTSLYYGQESTGTVGTNWWNYGYVTSPTIDLSGVTNAILSFSHLCAGDYCLRWDDDMICVDVSSNNFQTSSTPVMGLPNGGALWGNVGAYEGPTVTVDISEFAGQTNVQIRFSATFSQYCWEHMDISECPPTEGYYVDDIAVIGNVDLPPEE